MNAVYAFYYKDTNICAYVGSSKNFWNRLGKHLVDYHGNKQQYKLYTQIKERGGWDNIRWEVLESNINPEDLLQREKHYYLELKPSGNRQSPFQTPEERAEQIKQKNRDRNLPQVVCDCGSVIPAHNVKRHMLTQKHQTWASTYSFQLLSRDG